MNIIRAVATHSGQLERWLGKEEVEHVSSLMKDWYGPPIALAGVPGKVFAHRGGAFRGPILSGRVATARCAVESFVQRVKRGWRHASRSGQLNVGFASLSDLIAEATAGKARHFSYLKGPVTGVVGVSSSLLQLGSYPPAAANASAAPGGDVPVDSTTGFFQFVNPTGGDTQHFVSGFPLANVSGQTNLLYDCLFRVNKTINSTATEAVTGVPTRYQSTTAGADDYIGGNFLFVQVGGTALAATAHNWTVCTYLDQANAASTMPSLTGVSGAITHRYDHTSTGQWFAPLESGDVGIKALTQMQCSALVATGVINFVIGHPIAWMPSPVANIMCIADGINTAFNLVRVFDDAALAIIQATAASATATTYSGQFVTVAG